MGELKFYVGNVNSKLRVSFNLGYLFTASNTENFGIDFGTAVGYKLDKNLFTELNLRMNLGRIDVGGNSAGVPAQLMLNIYYNVNGD